MALADVIGRVQDNCSALVSLSLAEFNADFNLSQKRLPGMPDVWTRLGSALSGNTVLTSLSLPTEVPEGNQVAYSSLVIV